MVLPVTGSRQRAPAREPRWSSHWPAETVIVPAGGGLCALSVRLREAPPPGAGVNTVMIRGAAAAMSLARMVALS